MGVAQFNQVSEVWLTQIGCAGWRGGLALSLVFLWCRFVRRTPASIQCGLWRLAFLNLLTAGLWISPLELRLLPRVDPVSGSTVKIDRVVGPAQVGPFPGDVESRAVDLADGHFSRVDAVDLPARTMARISPSGWLLIVWCVGMLLMGFRLLRHWSRVRVLMRRATVIANPRVAHRLDFACQLVGQKLRPGLRSSSEAGSPCLIGILRPVIVMPSKHSDQSATAGRLRRW